MFYYYAQLNANNVCFAVSSLSGPREEPNLISIPEPDNDFIYRKYENGEWSVEKFLPNAPAVELTRVEKLEASQLEQDDLLLKLVLGGDSI